MTGAWMLNRHEVIAYPAKQVLALAEKVAKGKDAGLRFNVDRTAVSNDTKTDPLEQPAGYRNSDQA